MNLINLEISSSLYATSSNSLIYPSEKALAKTKYCANLDLRLILSPSGDISDYENIKYNYVNENDYAAYGWSETGITLTPRTWTPIPLSTTGGTNIEISDGKMKIKKRGTYLVNVFFHVKNTVNGTPYYD